MNAEKTKTAMLSKLARKYSPSHQRPSQEASYSVPTKFKVPPGEKYGQRYEENKTPRRITTPPKQID